MNQNLKQTSSLPFRWDSAAFSILLANRSEIWNKQCKVIWNGGLYLLTDFFVWPIFSVLTATKKADKESTVTLVLIPEISEEI